MNALECLQQLFSHKLRALLPKPIRDVMEDDYVWPHDDIQRELHHKAGHIRIAVILAFWPLAFGLRRLRPRRILRLVPLCKFASARCCASVGVQWT